MEDDVVERTANTRLELAVEVGEFQCALGWSSQRDRESDQATWFPR